MYSSNKSISKSRLFGKIFKALLISFIAFLYSFENMQEEIYSLQINISLLLILSTLENASIAFKS